MKKLLLVIMALCIVFTAGSALAEDYTQDAFDSFTYMVRDENLDMREDYPDAFQGKAIFGLYYDLFSDPLEISSVTLRETGDFYGIPREVLASSIDDADWAFLIYAEETGSEGEDVLPIRVMIFAVDAKNAVFYRPYELDTRETILENDGRTYDLGPSIRGWDEFMLYPEWRKANAAYDDAYRMALQYLKDEKYFSAWEAFSASEAEDAEERAAACIQPWPDNGEIWRDRSAGNGNMQLTVTVDQPDDHALLVRILKDGNAVSCLFIGGTGEATATLPAGTYVIKDGSGEQWFGVREAFGRYGNYETMTFYDVGTEEVTLNAGYAYTIRINVEEISPEAEGIGSEYEDWEGFAD